MATAQPWLVADWPAPPGVTAFTTLRQGGGGSLPPFDQFNMGNRSAADGDDPQQVQRNRDQLTVLAGLPAAPHWLRQVHGTDVLQFSAPPTAVGVAAEPTADAAVTATPGVVLAILTADCLPVVFAARDGTEVAAAHAGWPGLAAGMLEATVGAMRTAPERLQAWIGPAAGPQRYEVGVNVREAFLDHDTAAEAAFVATREGHWRVDLFQLARMRLQAVGVGPAHVHGGTHCSISDAQRFYSYRRDGRTGRMATLVWMG